MRVTLYTRGLDPEMRRRVVEGAHFRGLRVAEYLSRLVELHNAMRQLADDGDGEVQAELEALGLQTISR